MANLRTCHWCGKRYDVTKVSGGWEVDRYNYCSARCQSAEKRERQRESQQTKEKADKFKKEHPLISFIIGLIIFGYFAVLLIMDFLGSKGNDKQKQNVVENVVQQSIAEEKIISQSGNTMEFDTNDEIGLVQTPLQFVVIDESNINLWEQPTTNSETLKWEDGSNCYPLEGEKYKSFGELAGFYLIDFHGKRVWVEKQYVHIESEVIPEQPAQPISQSHRIEEENMTIGQSTIHQVIEAENAEDNVTPIEEEDFSKQKIYDIVGKMPSFPGGEMKLMEYLAQNRRYPQEALDRGIHGRVFVSFVVEPNGSISNVKVLRGIGYGCDEEAMRVVKTMPKWTPGERRGKPVRVAVTILVNFCFG